MCDTQRRYSVVFRKRSESSPEYRQRLTAYPTFLTDDDHCSAFGIWRAVCVCDLKDDNFGRPISRLNALVLTNSNLFEKKRWILGFRARCVLAGHLCSRELDRGSGGPLLETVASISQIRASKSDVLIQKLEIRSRRFSWTKFLMLLAGYSMSALIALIALRLLYSANAALSRCCTFERDQIRRMCGRFQLSSMYGE